MGDYTLFFVNIKRSCIPVASPYRPYRGRWAKITTYYLKLIHLSKLNDPVKERTAMQTANDIKKALHSLADQLPDDATWKDIAYEAYVRQEIEAGLAETKRGEFAGEDEIKDAFKRWGVQVET